MRHCTYAAGLLFAAHTLVGARLLLEEREGLVVGVYNDGSQLPLAHPEPDGSWGGECGGHGHPGNVANTMHGGVGSLQLAPRREGRAAS